MIRTEEVYKIGKLGKAHGVKGEISMQVDDDIFDRLDDFTLPTGEGQGGGYLVLLLDGIMVPFFIEEYRFKTDETALIKFDGIDTQERARELTGTEVYFPRQLADNDDSDELCYAQLVGYTVINGRTGNSIGTIDFVDEQTLNIMFELKDGTLIPASEELILGIDTEKQTITMDIPEGILSL